MEGARERKRESIGLRDGGEERARERKKERERGGGEREVKSKRKELEAIENVKQNEKKPGKTRKIDKSTSLTVSQKGPWNFKAIKY